MSDSRPSSGCTPAAKQQQFPRSSESREWQLLEPELLCQALAHDSDAALRRAARAVCRDWRAVVDSRLITQLCCDIDHLPRIRPLPGLRHVVVHGEIRRTRNWQKLQQALWAHARQSRSSIRSSKGPVLQDLPAPRGDLSPLAALPGVQAATLRCLPLLTRNFQQQAAHLTHLTSLTLHEPPNHGRSKSHVKGVRQALLALPHLKALSLIDVEGNIVQRVLQQRWGTATAAACPWLTGLQSLTVQHSSLPPMRDALASLTSCTSLALINCSLSRGLPACLGQLANLQVLDLSYSRSSIRLPKSCWSCLTALTRLSLSGDGLQGYRHVPFKDMPSLVHLDLRDQTFRAKALLGCTALQVLDVRGSQMDDATATALDAALTQQPALKRVLYGRRGQPDNLVGLPIVENHPRVTFVFDWEWEYRQIEGEGGSIAWYDDSDSDSSSSSSDSDSGGGFRLCHSISPPPRDVVSYSSLGTGSQSKGWSDTGSDSYSTGSGDDVGDY